MINTRPLKTVSRRCVFLPDFLKNFHESVNILWMEKHFLVSNSLLNHHARYNFTRDKNSNNNSWNTKKRIHETTHPTVKIKLFGSRRGKEREGWPQVQADKKLFLTRPTSSRVRATEMCPLLSPFLPFFFPLVSASAKRLLAPFIPNQIPDPLVWRRFRFPEGLERFASFSPPRGDPLSSSSSLIRTFLFEGRIGRKSRVGYREFSAIPLHLAGILSRCRLLGNCYCSEIGLQIFFLLLNEFCLSCNESG